MNKLNVYNNKGLIFIHGPIPVIIPDHTFSQVKIKSHIYAVRHY